MNFKWKTIRSFFKALLNLKQNLFQLSKLSKLCFLALILVYLMGYQPVWDFPPVKQSVVHASDLNQTEEVINKDSFSEEFKLPHVGYLSTKFSSWHPGIDIATGLGMPIHPIMKGKVVDVEYTFWGLGSYLTIEHERGFKSTYGHMGRIFVKVGDLVNSDSIIGNVGLTGWTSGPHTHLEISRDGKPTDPEKLLPKIPALFEYAKTQESNQLTINSNHGSGSTPH